MEKCATDIDEYLLMSLLDEQKVLKDKLQQLT